MSSLEEAYDWYHEGLTAEADIAESEQWFVAVEQNYIDGVKSANAWLKSQTETKDSNDQQGDTDSHVSSAGTFGPADLIYMLALPKAGLDIYSGDPLEYESHFAVFDETVHNRVDDDHMRLTRLLQYTGGLPRQLLRRGHYWVKTGMPKLENLGKIVLVTVT